MTTTTFPPPAVEADQVLPQLRERGYAVLNAATVSQWVNSPGHCQAMMSATYVHVGGACRYNASTQYGYYWTIDLGKPF